MRKYTKSRLSEKLNIARNITLVTLFSIVGATITVNALTNTDVEEPIVVEITPIEESTVDNKVKSISDLNLCGGVATVFESDLTTEELIALGNQIIAEKESYVDGFEEPQYIRCTGYCDYGYTKSGDYVRRGIVAGKEEWIGKTCVIYQVDENGDCGDLIGYYEFLDTGYGIEGSLVDGTSIDVWFPSEEEVWTWMETYGDYVYIQIMNSVG